VEKKRLHRPLPQTNNDVGRVRGVGGGGMRGENVHPVGGSRRSPAEKPPKKKK